jgi:hypothetical protein
MINKTLCMLRATLAPAAPAVRLRAVTPAAQRELYHTVVVSFAR